MESPTCRRNTRALVVFWSLMMGCGVLTAVCAHLAGREHDRPWAGFSLNTFGHVMQAHNTDLVFFDTILAVDGQSVQRHAGTAAAIHEVLRRTPVGTPLTYRVRRGETQLEVVVPVQQTTWRRLTMEFGLPLLVALGQLGMGVLVFLLRPNTPRSWRFLGFCVVWFGLFMTIFDFQSTHVLTHVFLFCWYLTSATLLHLAFVFPDERPMVRRHPHVQWLFYLPSLGLWGCERLADLFFHDVYKLYHIGMHVAQVHTVYWGITLLVLLASLMHTAVRASSAVARRRAGTVCVGFAAGFLLPVGSESVALLYHVNLPLGCLWVLTLFLPLSITYAILRYNLFDLSAMVRRTLTYAVLTALVIGAYLLLIWIRNTIVQGIPLSQTGGFPVLFGLGVLCVLNPLRACVQHMLDRTFFRTRYDFRQTIQALSQDLTALLDLDEIAQRLVTTVTRALNVASAALYLDNGSGVYRPLAVLGEAADRLARLEPRRGHAVVELIARQRRGISQYDLEADPGLAQHAPRALTEFARLGVSLALPLLCKDTLIGMLALSGASGKNLVLSQVSWNSPDRITWHGIDAKKSEANLADAPLRRETRGRHLY